MYYVVGYRQGKQIRQSLGTSVFEIAKAKAPFRFFARKYNSSDPAQREIICSMYEQKLKVTVRSPAPVRCRNGPAAVSTSRRCAKDMSARNGKTKQSRAALPSRNGDPEVSRSAHTPLEQIRVVIADDHPVARQGLSAILGLMDDVKVVAEAADGEEALKLYHQHSPDVLRPQR